MKKTFSNFRTLAALLMAGAAFAACSSNDDNIIENQQPANPGEQVYTLTINASKGDGTTRALDLDGTGKLTASWTNGDELTVVNLTKSFTALGGTLTASNASGSTATFSGTLSGTIDVDDQLILRYQEYDYFGSEFKSQDGTLKGTNGAEKYDCANALVTVASVDGSGNITISESAASFTTYTAMLKLTLQDGSSNALNATSLTISVGDEELYTFSPTAATYTTNGDGILYFAMPSAENVAYIKLGATPSDIDEKKATLAAATVTFTATVGGTTYTATKPGYKFTEGKYYAATLTMAAAAVPSDLYVDLGLSVKWAKCNLGATSPEQYGNYFAWGETSGYDDGKTNFAWSNYAWGTSNTALTKYCSNSANGKGGFSDALTTLLPEDDAAYANWGGKFRMPTSDEWNELLNPSNCSKEWKDDYLGTGVSGYLFTSLKAGHTDKSIFLPAAGRRQNNIFYNVGSNGFYWSSSLFTDVPANSWSFNFGNNFTEWDGYARFNGLSIRPVYAE